MQRNYLLLMMFVTIGFMFMIADQVKADHGSNDFELRVPVSGDGKKTGKSMIGATAADIKIPVGEAIRLAKQALNARNNGDVSEFVAKAESALTEAKDAQRAGHNEYLNEGVYELGEAIEHGRKQQKADATEHIQHAIMRLSQAADLQVP